MKFLKNLTMYYLVALQLVLVHFETNLSLQDLLLEYLEQSAVADFFQEEVFVNPFDKSLCYDVRYIFTLVITLTVCRLVFWAQTNITKTLLKYTLLPNFWICYFSTSV